MNSLTSTRSRAIFAVAIVILLLPIGVSGLTALTAGGGPAESGVETATNVTFVSTQGTEVGTEGKLVGVKTDTKETIWKHDKYERYYDIDPIDDDRILFVANAENINETLGMVAVVMNWRTGEVLTKFSVPRDTHDIDYIGDHEYAIADLEHDGVTVYNASQGKTVWKYAFYDQQFSKEQDGEPKGGWTHVNDIDAVNNGSAFLVSPRNFDRVMLINRSTKDVEWVLGEENNYTILNEQHNPALLTQDPPTVLVADSNNGRIIEYRKTEAGWTQTWEKSGFGWPRDADRLPNGNTLIVDSYGQRVVEVTPQKEVVWGFEIKKMPYDVERLQYGDEPTGPPMHQLNPTAQSHDNSKTGVLGMLVSRFNYVYSLSQWILPGWIGKLSFLSFAVAGLVGGVWMTSELNAAVSPLIQTHNRVREWSRQLGAVFGAGLAVFGFALLVFAVKPFSPNPVYLVLGVLVARVGSARSRSLAAIPNIPDVYRELGRIANTLLSIVSLGAGGFALIQVITAEQMTGFYLAAAAVLFLEGYSELVS